MTTLAAKREQLAGIRHAADCLRQRKPSLARSVSIAVGVVAGFVAFVLNWHWLWVGIVGIIAGLFVFCFVPLSRSWAELLDDKLTAYEPVDDDAYSELHQTTRAIGGIDLNAVDAWFEKEWLAVCAMTPPQPHGPARRFIDKPMNQNNEQSGGDK